MMVVLGITDERTTCDCCGRQNLKCTVAMDRSDADGNCTGDVVYYGRDCASRAIYGNNKSGNVKNIGELARWIELARKWFVAGHSVDVVLDALRRRTGYAIDREGDTIRFVSRVDNSVMAEVSPVPY
jgi:hypothetical protein